MKSFFVIALLFLTTSAFCDFRGERDYSNSGEQIYISAGYSQSLNGTTPVGNSVVGISFFPFESYGMRLEIDFLHFQIAPTDRFQTVSDESLLQLTSLIWALPISLFYTKNGPQLESERYFYIVGGMFFLMHGALYFPVLPNDWFGFINKHRFVTETITKGLHCKSFTFQDDLGGRINIYMDDSKDGSSHVFVDGGIRFEKNFSRDFEKKWFLQVGYMSH